MTVQAYSGPKRKILIDQGSADEFLQNQLKPENFQEACSGNPAISLDLRIQVGKDGAPFPLNLQPSRIPPLVPLPRLPPLCTLARRQEQKTPFKPPSSSKSRDGGWL